MSKAAAQHSIKRRVASRQVTALGDEVTHREAPQAPTRTKCSVAVVVLQLFRREGLHKVVVGAALQALHTIGDIVSRGKYERGRDPAALSRPHQPCEAIAIGQAQVEHDEFEALLIFVVKRRRRTRPASHRVSRPSHRLPSGSAARERSLKHFLSGLQAKVNSLVHSDAQRGELPYVACCR